MFHGQSIKLVLYSFSFKDENVEINLFSDFIYSKSSEEELI